MPDCIIRKIKGERDLGHVTSSQRGLVDIDRAIKDRKGRTNAILYESSILFYKYQNLALCGHQLWNLDDPKEVMAGTARRSCRRRPKGLPSRTHSN